MSLDCILLAGGQSKRMGKDKAFLPYKNKTFLRNILETLDVFCSKFILVVNKDFSLYEKEIKGINSQVILVKDKNPYDGPLNGIVSAENYVESDLVFIATCDTPVIDLNLLDYLKNQIDQHDAVIPDIDGKLQPLNTFYKRSAIKNAVDVYSKNGKSLMAWLDKLNYKTIHKNEIIKFDKNMLTFKSINTPEMYNWLIKMEKK